MGDPIHCPPPFQSTLVLTVQTAGLHQHEAQDLLCHLGNGPQVRVKAAHSRQSSPDTGLELQGKIIIIFQRDPSSLGAGPTPCTLNYQPWSRRVVGRLFVVAEPGDPSTPPLTSELGAFQEFKARICQLRAV